MRKNTNFPSRLVSAAMVLSLYLCRFIDPTNDVTGLSKYVKVRLLTLQMLHV